MLTGDKRFVLTLAVWVSIFAQIAGGLQALDLEASIQEHGHEHEQEHLVNNNNNNKYNVHDSAEGLHSSSYGQLFYNEPEVGRVPRGEEQLSRQKRAQGLGGDSEGDTYNHHADGQQGGQLAQPDYAHQIDSMELGGLEGSELGDRFYERNRDQPNGFSEIVLSNGGAEGTESTAVTQANSHEPNGGPNQMDMDENNLGDKTLLTRKLIERTCHLDRGSLRSEQLNNTYLTHCSRYKLENLLSNEILMSIMHHDRGDCERILDEFVQLDETINQFDSLFIKLLSRYNCHNGYSVKWNCDDCKKAYKDWLCSTHLPLYMNGERIKPCISFCERVEQRCPYLHPITREQYGGQPVFICRDPNIPFVPAITPDIPYSEPGKCYDLCHLSDNLTELVIDSLSKYDYDKCPDRGSIAGEVRSEQQGSPNGSDPLLLRPPASSVSSPTDTGDYFDGTPSSEEENSIVLANRTGPGGQTKVVLPGHGEQKATTHVHNKKLEELREVLANYKNQAKTHRYHADHSAIDQSKAQNEIHSS